MRFARLAMILFTTLSFAAPAAGIAGNWTVIVVGGVRHKTISQAIFEFKVNGNRLTGTADIGNSALSYYPGIASLSDGEIDGDHISFTVVGEHPSSNGVPTMKFAGTIHGDRLDLTMSLLDGRVDGGQMQMTGAKTSG